MHNPTGGFPDDRFGFFRISVARFVEEHHEHMSGVFEKNFDIRGSTAVRDREKVLLRVL